MVVYLVALSVPYLGSNITVNRIPVRVGVFFLDLLSFYLRLLLFLLCFLFILFLFSKFRKNLLGFSPCSSQSALDLMYAPLSSSFLIWINCSFSVTSFVLSSKVETPFLTKVSIAIILSSRFFFC